MIKIPQADFIKEHTKLIKLLNKYHIPELNKESSEQQKELNKVLLNLKSKRRN